MTEVLKMLTIQFWQMTLIGGFQVNDKGGTIAPLQNKDTSMIWLFFMNGQCQWPVLNRYCLLTSRSHPQPPRLQCHLVQPHLTALTQVLPALHDSLEHGRMWLDSLRYRQPENRLSTHWPAPLPPPRLHASLRLVTTSRLQDSALVLNSNFWTSPLTEWPALSSTHPRSNSPFWHCLTQRQEATFTDCYWLPGTLYWERCWGHIQTQWGKSTMMSLRWEKIHVMYLPSGFRIFTNIGPPPLWFQRPNSLFHNSNILDLLDLFITKYFPTSNAVLLHSSHSSTSPTFHSILIRTFKHEALLPHPLKSLPCFTGLPPLDSVVNS